MTRMPEAVEMDLVAAPTGARAASRSSRRRGVRVAARGAECARCLEGTRGPVVGCDLDDDQTVHCPPLKWGSSTTVLSQLVVL